MQNTPFIIINDTPKMDTIQVLEAQLFNSEFDPCTSPTLHQGSDSESGSSPINQNFDEPLMEFAGDLASPNNLYMNYPQFSYPQYAQMPYTQFANCNVNQIAQQQFNDYLEAKYHILTQRCMQQEPIIEQKVATLTPMQKFPDTKVTDFKHVIYNLLVDNFNNKLKGSATEPDLVEPCSIIEDGKVRLGFRFLEDSNPEKKLPELYALHIRNSQLDKEDQSSIFIQDLYKYYLRSCVELLSKYFEKKGKYTFLYDGAPLFLPGSTLRDAEKRMKTMKTRARMQKKRKVVESL